MSKTVRVGQMPGQINTFAVENGTSISALLELAGYSAADIAGFEVKVDGTKVTDLNSAKVEERTDLVLLVKQVKGNADRVVRVGIMPGTIQEVAMDDTQSFASAIELAGLDSNGYDVKADGNKVNDLNAAVGNTSLILLVKQVKGNADRIVRVGIMPGTIQEVAVDSEATIAQALEIAGLSASGYDVKLDGNKASDLNTSIGNTQLILLVKQVKGNNIGEVATQGTYGYREVRVGVMPGQVNSYSVQLGNATVGQVIELAGLDPAGYDVKVDGAKVTDFNTQITSSTNLILLVKQVKGNK